jgi:hypothetical protein
MACIVEEIMPQGGREMPSQRVNRRLSASLSLAAMVACVFAFSASCSSSSLGPANGASCQVNSDCASNCCVAGGYPAQAGNVAKVCTEPTGCSGQDSSVSTVDSSMEQDSAAAETGTGDSSPATDSGSGETDTGSVDSSSPEDSAPHDSGPHDAGKG